MAELITDRQILAELLEERADRKRKRKLYTYFPDEGPLAPRSIPKALARLPYDEAVQARLDDGR
jgi:hypothetical protein